MTQATALLVHDLMDTPDRWHEKADGIITNGYYSIHMDGSRYSAGLATYHAEEADREVLRKAIRQWKDDRAASPLNPAQKEAAATQLSKQIEKAIPVKPKPTTGDEFAHAFVNNVRNAHKAYLMHKDQNIFSAVIENMLHEYDAVMKGTRI